MNNELKHPIEVGKVIFSDISKIGVLVRNDEDFAQHPIYHPLIYDILSIKNSEGPPILLKVTDIEYCSTNNFGDKYYITPKFADLNKLGKGNILYEEKDSYNYKILICSIINISGMKPININDRVYIPTAEDLEWFYSGAKLNDKDTLISIGRIKNVRTKIEFEFPPSSLFQNNMLILGAKDKNKLKMVSNLVEKLNKSTEYPILFIDPMGMYSNSIKLSNNQNKRILSLTEARSETALGFGSAYMENQEILNELGSSLSSNDYDLLKKVLEKASVNSVKNLKGLIKENTGNQGSKLIESLENRYHNVSDLLNKNMVSIIDFTKKITPLREEENELSRILDEIFYEALRRNKLKQKKGLDAKDVDDLNLLIFIDDIDKYCQKTSKYYDKEQESHLKDIILNLATRSDNLKISIIGISSFPSKIYKDMLYLCQNKIISRAGHISEEKVYSEILNMPEGMTRRLRNNQSFFVGPLSDYTPYIIEFNNRDDLEV